MNVSEILMLLKAEKVLRTQHGLGSFTSTLFTVEFSDEYPLSEKKYFLNISTFNQPYLNHQATVRVFSFPKIILKYRQTKIFLTKAYFEMYIQSLAELHRQIPMHDGRHRQDEKLSENMLSQTTYLITLTELWMMVIILRK